MSNIIKLLEAEGNFTILLRAIDTSLLTDKLSKEGPFTLFAADDIAFDKIEKIEVYLKHPFQMRRILLHHILEGNVRTRDLTHNKRFRNLLGLKIKLWIDPRLQIEQSLIIRPNIEAENGVIHVIDEALIPKEKVRHILSNPFYRMD